MTNCEYLLYFFCIKLGHTFIVDNETQGMHRVLLSYPASGFLTFLNAVFMPQNEPSLVSSVQAIFVALKSICILHRLFYSFNSAPMHANFPTFNDAPMHAIFTK